MQTHAIVFGIVCVSFNTDCFFNTGICQKTLNHDAGRCTSSVGICQKTLNHDAGRCTSSVGICQKTLNHDAGRCTLLIFEGTYFY